MNQTMIAAVLSLACCGIGAVDEEQSKLAEGAKSVTEETEVMMHLPIKQAEGNREFRVDEGHWVYVTAQISQVGKAARIDGELTGINRTVFAGFHAAGIITLFDDRDNVIIKMLIPKQLGVNGTALGGSSRTEPFVIDLPERIAMRVRRFEVKGFARHHPNFVKEVKKIVEEGQKVFGENN